MSTLATKVKVKREELNPCTILLTITPDADQVKAGFDKAIKKLGKQVRIPGFRPGSAPKKLIEEALNPQAVMENAAEEIVRSTYEAAIKQEEITPYGFPNIDIKEFDREKAECNFTAKVPLKPHLELSDLKSLKAEKLKVETTDEEVQAQIEEFRRRAGTKQEVTDRGIKEGDVAVINIKPSEDESGKTFMIVVGQTFPELDETLMGMNTEDVKAKKLSFPDKFQNPDWAGKQLACQVMVQSVSALQMPELDDEFAKSLNTENLEDLNQKVRELISNAKERSVDDMVRSQLLDNLIASSTVHVADTAWESVMQRRMDEIQQALREQKTSFEDFLKSNGLTEEEFVDRLREDAQLNVKRAVVIQKIFEDNKMSVQQEDLNRFFLEVAQENNVPQDKLDEFAKQNGQGIRDEVIFRTMASKVTDFLKETAQIKEVEKLSDTTGAKEKPTKASAKAKASETSEAKTSKKPSKKGK